MAKSKTIPPWGRPQAEVARDVAAQVNSLDTMSVGAPMGKVPMGEPTDYIPDQPIGTNQTGVRWAVLEGGMPNDSRRAKGRIKAQAGKYKNYGPPIP